MSRGTVRACLVVGVLLLVVGGFVWWAWKGSIRTQAHELSNQVAAKETANKNYLSNINSTLKSKANVAELSFDKMAELHKAIAQAKGSGGLLAKFITDNGGTVPNSQELFAELSREITTAFNGLTRVQDELLDLDLQYDNLRVHWLYESWLADFEDLEYTIVLSQGAIDSFETGVRPELDLFPNSKGADDNK